LTLRKQTGHIGSVARDAGTSPSAYWVTCGSVKITRGDRRATFGAQSFQQFETRLRRRQQLFDQPEERVVTPAASQLLAGPSITSIMEAHAVGGVIARDLDRELIRDPTPFSLDHGSR
jgi:hypothetical protein